MDGCTASTCWAASTASAPKMHLPANQFRSSVQMSSIQGSAKIALRPRSRQAECSLMPLGNQAAVVEFVLFDGAKKAHHLHSQKGTPSTETSDTQICMSLMVAVAVAALTLSPICQWLWGVAVLTLAGPLSLSRHQCFSVDM